MELSDYLVQQNTVDKFATYANTHGLQRRNLMIRKSHNLLERYINSRIIYNMLDEQALTEYLNLDDKAVLKAVELFRTGNAWPKKPVKNDKAGAKK